MTWSETGTLRTTAWRWRTSACGEDGLRLDAFAAGGGAEDFLLLVRERVIHPDVEHEAVELRFGERVGALLFDRVLRREDEEGFLQRVGGVAGGDHFLLHRLEQRGLRLRRRAVDFVGEEQVAKNGAADEAELLFAGGGIRLEHVGADDVARHEVGRELHALELEIEHLRDGADHERLGHAGQADEQRVAVGQDAHEDLIEHVDLADDDFADFAPDLIRAVAHLLDEREFVGTGRGHTRRSAGRSGFGVKDEAAAADLDEVAGRERRGGDLGLVEPRAVGTAEIDDGPSAVRESAARRVRRRSGRRPAGGPDRVGARGCSSSAVSVRRRPAKGPSLNSISAMGKMQCAREAALAREVESAEVLDLIGDAELADGGAEVMHGQRALRVHPHGVEIAGAGDLPAGADILEHHELEGPAEVGPAESSLELREQKFGPLFAKVSHDGARVLAAAGLALDAVDDALGEERLGLLDGGFDFLEVVGGERAVVAVELQPFVKGGGVDDDEIVFADGEILELERGRAADR